MYILKRSLYILNRVFIHAKKSPIHPAKMPHKFWEKTHTHIIRCTTKWWLYNRFRFFCFFPPFFFLNFSKHISTNTTAHICTTNGGLCTCLFFMIFFFFSLFLYPATLFEIRTSIDATAHMCTTHGGQFDPFVLFAWSFFIFSCFFFPFPFDTYAHLWMPLRTCALQTGNNPITSTSLFVFCFLFSLFFFFLFWSTHDYRCHCAHVQYKRGIIPSPPLLFTFFFPPVLTHTSSTASAHTFSTPFFTPCSFPFF